MKKSLLLLFCIIISLPFFNACSTISSTHTGEEDWTKTDILYFEGLDSSNSRSEILAVYFRFLDHPQVRIDFLELEKSTPLEIKLLLDNQPGSDMNITTEDEKNKNWDFEIIFNQDSKTILNESGITDAAAVPIDFNFDSLMDTLIVDWQKNFNTKNLKIKVFCRISGQETWQDQTGVISVFSSNPKIEAPLILEFWNVLPAETPAQTLRYWDGAHSGPFGRRHGLKYLLQTAEIYQIPLFLLDLQNPQSLSTINYLGQYDYIHSLLSNGLLVLPEYRNLSLARTPGKCLGWESAWNIPSKFLFTNSLQTLTENFSAAFIYSKSQDHLYQYSQKTLIPLPSPFFDSQNETEPNEIINQINNEGLSFEVKKALVEKALSDDKGDLLVLGGNFRQSPWGDPDMAAAAMSYLSNHPWINVLDGYETLTFPTLAVHNLDTGDCTDLLCTPLENGLYTNANLEYLFLYKYNLRSQFDDLQENIFSALAKESMIYLISYPVELDLLTLKLNYLKTIEPLIEASNWLKNSAEQQICKEDYCILSSETLFFVISKKDGSLIFAGSNINEKPLQWIASSANTAVGLSDPSDWLVKDFRIFDPAVINGGFSQTNAPEGFYGVYLEDDGIIFKNTQTGAQKTYQIAGNTLNYTATGFENQEISIPLLFSPLMHFTADWKNEYFPAFNQTSEEFQITFGEDYRLSILSENAEIISVDSFSDSYSWISEPEDPDRENPDGHYLPYPLILIKIKTGGSFRTSITFENN